MKKLMAWSLLLVVLFSFGAAKAADAGVVVIGGPESQINPISLDDMKLNVMAEIPGYAEVTLTDFGYADKLNYYWYDSDDREFNSKNDADFALLYLIILNTSTKGVQFLEEISNIVFTYRDEYTYQGFAYRCNQNWYYPKYALNFEDRYIDDYKVKYPEIYTIKPMFEGHYVIGGTLPNAVVNGKDSLTLTFRLGENELTYRIRK